MRIKSIKKTNRFQAIPMSILQDGSHHEVLTPFGWADVRNFGYIKSGPSKVIKHANDCLICDPGHVLMIDRSGVRTAARADQLDPQTDRLYTYNDRLLSFTVEDGQQEDFYDITIDEPHWWYTSGMVSHNSILLCNNAISSLQGIGPDGTPGQNVLLITFELDTLKTAMRCLGTATDIPMNNIVEHQDFVRRIISKMQKTYNKRFAIYEWAPEECSVSDIYALLDNLYRVHSFKPDVIIIDYMDLMISRNNAYNKDDYIRQKHIAAELRGLAKNENVLLFTATQTNRSGSSGEELADMNKVAESFGKQFALDYVISLNQSKSQRCAEPPRITMYIAKNRNGPRAERVECTINYNTMVVREEI